MNDDRLTQILENVAREQLVGSIHLVTTGRQSKSVFIAPEGSLSATISNDYIQTSKGQRYFDSVLAFDGGVKIHRRAYCDGTRCAEVVFHQVKTEQPVRIQISQQFLDDMGNNTLSIPFPFGSYYVGPKPLVEALPAAERLAEAEVIGRRCDAFLFKSVGPSNRKEDFVYCLDKQTSVPLKVACYVKRAHLAIDRPLWSWEASTLNDVAEHHVALTSRWTRFIVKDASQDSPPKVNMTTDITVGKVEFDRDLPATAFWPVQEDAVVRMNLAKWRDGGKTGSREPIAASDLIRVPEPRSTPWAMFAVIFLAIALIAAAIAFRTARSVRA